MTELLTLLTPFLLADVLNPVLFGFMVVAAGTARPILNSSALLLGHTLAYFGAGILLSFGLEAVTERLGNPQDIDFVLGLVIGLACLGFALPSRKPAQKKTEEEAIRLTPLSAISWGAILNFVGIPFALPYFAALGQILSTDITSAQQWLALVLYNLAYTLPFLVVPVMVAISGDAAKPLLQKINGWLDRGSEVLMPLLLAGLGLALVTDAVMYFSGRPALF
jgi:cytochrome c biogenesis protein CcdA